MLSVEGKGSAYVTLAHALSGPVHDPWVSVISHPTCSFGSSGIKSHNAVGRDQF